ncbi:MAG: nucleotide sugar dehydrogenase [Anaerolineae bacterium]|nr:MAG: nucleotide sugar dehydrogenase [Anaerolineae bacterium]
MPASQCLIQYPAVSNDREDEYRMSLQDLTTNIQNKSAKLAVIGLGYVGLPVACEFARVGFDVLGVDILTERVAKINAGQSPIEGEEPGLAALLAEVIGGGKLRATTNYEDLRDRDIILIDVETPVDDQNIPRYRALHSVLTHLGPVLKEGALVIIESTIAPGTVRDVVVPMLQESSGRALNQGFFVGNCPERVMPGKLLANLRGLSRVCGGTTPETSEALIALYRHIVHADLDPADCVTAEIVKTAENAYRDVQIAFANELAMVCEMAGGDVWKVREMVNKSPGRNVHLPGAGVGGHCIPKDPWLLAYGVHDKGPELNLIPTARRVNDSMPKHVLHLLTSALAEHAELMQGKEVLVLGYAYLEDSDDTRNSPSAAFVAALQTVGAQARVHDPFIRDFQGDVLEMAKGADAAVLLVKHSAYKALDLSALARALAQPVFVDGRGLFTSEVLESAGFTYRIIGVGKR